MRFVVLSLVLLFFEGAASAAPSVESDGVSGVGTDFLELNASVNSFSGSSVDVGVEYREAGSSDWNRSGLESFTSTGTFQVGAEGLQESTEYELRAYAEDEDGSDTGSILKANTTMLKTISSEEGSLVADSVVLEPLDLGEGNVGVDFLNFRGDISELGSVSGVEEIDVNISYRPEGDTEWNSVQADVVTEDRIVSERVDGLDSTTTYEYRVETREEISSVEKVNTTMLKTVPSDGGSLQADSVVLEPLDLGKGNVGVDFLNFSGDVSDLGSVVDVADVDVNVSYRPEGSTEWNSVQADVITEDKVISERVDGLDPQTTYEYRVETKEQISDVEKVNTTMLKTVPSATLSLTGEPSICDERGLLDECISKENHEIAGTQISINERFEARETVLFQAFTGMGALNIKNSTSISGVWRGSFNISSTGETRIESGAEFDPGDDGRIVLGR